jgi:hypothetical protein
LSSLATTESPDSPRFAATLVTAGVVVVALAYAAATSVSALEAGSPRAARAWFAGILAALAAVAALRRRRPFRRSPLVWVGVEAAAAVLLAACSGRAISVLVAAGIAGAAWLAGDAVRQILGIRARDTAAESALFAPLLGLPVLALAVLAAGLCRALNAATLAILLGLLVAARSRRLLEAVRWSARRARRRLAAPPPAEFPEARILLPGMGLVLLLELAWALAPEVQFDALNYHLAVPKIWLERGAVIRLPYFWHSYLAHMVEALYALALSLGGQTAAKLLSLGCGALLALGAYALARRAFGRRPGLWAAALVLSTPLIAWLSTGAGSDNFEAVLLLAAILGVLRWFASGRPGWAAAAGLLAGAAVGAKLNAAFGVPVLAAAFLAAPRGPRRVPRILGGLAAFSAAAAAAAAPWYLVTLAWTGNPVFPFLNGVFRSPLGQPVNQMMNASLFGIGTGPWAWPRLPLAVTFRSGLFGEGLRPGAFGAALLLVWLGIPLLARRRTHRAAGLLLAFVAVFFAAWAWTFQHARYLVPVVAPALAAAAGALLAPGAPRSRRLRLASLGLVAACQAAFVPVLFWQSPARVPWRFALGLQTPREFLASAMPGIEGVWYLNARSRPGERVAGLSADQFRFYLDAPLESLAESSGLARIVDGAPDRRVAERLRAAGFRFVLLGPGAAPGPGGGGFASPGFLDRYARLEFAAPQVRVYRLLAPGAPVFAPGRNEVENPGFEARGASGDPLDWHVYGRPVVRDDPAFAPGGRVSVRASPGGGFYELVPARPGVVYVLSHYTRASEPGQYARLQLNWLDAGGKMLRASIEIAQAGPNWELHRMFASAPPGAVSVQVYASVHENSSVWFDDFFFGPAGGRPPGP